jgi:fructan beta-fructosidase
VDQIVQTDVKPAPVDPKSPRPQLFVNAKRDFKIEKRYLHIPIKNFVPTRPVNTIIEGKVAVRNDIGLADGAPDWWAFMDVSAWSGKNVTLQVERMVAGSTALDSIEQSDSIKDSENLYREPLRGQLHFSSRRGWNNDPNGMVFSQGEYHLYYQLNPYGWGWGNMHWGHAVSPDMVHWKELPIAIYPHAPGDAVFSGSAVVDKANTSGWKKGSGDLLVAAFTSTGRGECIVYSNDKGRTFTECEGNPVVKHGGRDPRLLWHAPSNQWVMAVYDEGTGKQCVAFYTSPDLQTWTFQSRIEGFYECPDFFELPVDGVATNKKWVLTAASSDYMIGSFDGKTFTPETAKLPGNRGAGFYAAQTFTGDPKGRVVQIGWLQTETRGMPFNQAMSLPNQLSLRSTSDGPRLAWTPVDELKTLRVKSHDCGVAPLTPGAPNPLAKVSSELLELRATFTPPAKGEVKFTLRGIPVIYNTEQQVLSVNGHRAPAPLREGKIDLTVFTDRIAYEVFTAGGLTYVPLPCVPSATTLGAEVSVTGGDVTFEKLEVHELKSIWAKP